MLKIVKVRGDSMSPTLAPGDYMIVTKARAIRPGFVVLLDHPKYGRIVKRISSVNENLISLAGDGPNSTASDAMGQVSLTAVQGRIHWAITPKGIRRI